MSPKNLSVHRKLPKSEKDRALCDKKILMHETSSQKGALTRVHTEQQLDHGENRGPGLPLKYLKEKDLQVELGLK